MLSVRLCINGMQKRSFLSLGAFSNEEKNYKITKKIAVSRHLLYRVVADVSKYEEFVPFVTKSFVNQHDSTTGLPLEAGLRVGWNEYDEKFVCKLKCVKDESLVAESATISLFDYLHNEWKFKEVKSRFTNESSTLVDFSLKYKFKNPIYNTVSSMFHDRVSQVMMKAFEDRAIEMKIKEKLKDRLNN